MVIYDIWLLLVRVTDTCISSVGRDPISVRGLDPFIGLKDSNGSPVLRLVIFELLR